MMERIVLEIVFICISFLIIGSRLFAKDKSAIWNPLVFWNVYLLYYVLLPVFKQKVVLGVDWSSTAPLLLIGAILSLISIMVGYNFPMLKNVFSYSNKSMENLNSFRVGVALIVIGFFSYGVVKGFSLNLIVREQLISSFDPNASYNNPTFYILYLISCFCVGCPLIMTTITKQKRNRSFFLLAFLISAIIYVISGFRYRLLILISTLLTTRFLYPKIKKINYYLMGFLAFLIFLGMAFIEKTRSYGQGLDISRIENLAMSDMEASEGDFVASFSAEIIKNTQFEDMIFFEPIITAVAMPIPRSVFPLKPKGEYLRDANKKIYNSIEYGAAFIYFAEAYISFGWVGIILQGIFIGWICKIFWTNYKKHSGSLGSVILLGLFNGFCFVWVSRGYFAQVLTTYFYFIIIPFWIIRGLSKIKCFRVNQ